MLSQVLTEDAKRRDSSHDFGKDIFPRMVAAAACGCSPIPFQGYWVDVGTVDAYWQAQMDLLKDPPRARPERPRLDHPHALGGAAAGRRSMKARSSRTA